MEDARAAVALLSDFLTALDAEPVSTSGAADEVDRVRVAVDAVVNRPEVRADLESLGADPAALDAAATTVAGGDRGSVAAAGSGAATADTASSGRPGSNADTAGGEQRAGGASTADRASGGRDDGTFDTAGRGAAHRGEGLAAGVEKLTEQAARAAVADPAAVALLETLTDPGLNLDDLDTTNTSGASAGGAGETISRTNSATPSAIPALDPAPADAANDQEPAVAQPSSEPAPEKDTATVPDRVWDELVECESGGDWSARTGNGFSGGLQFTPSTWTAFGGQGEAHEASRAEQIAVAQRVQEGQGWKAWPSCAKKLGLTD